MGGGGELLVCEREPKNVSDRYAVAVKEELATIGHLPQKVPQVCSLFLRQGGSYCRMYSNRAQEIFS